MMYRYPVEVISDIYVSRIGGYSYELEEDELGINSGAIAMRTSLIPKETFVTLGFLDRKMKPYFFRRRFLVVGIEENMESYEKTKNGEVVLSDELEEKVEVGKEVIINSVEFFRIDKDLSAILEAFKCYRLKFRNDN
ncbi:MAG: hypothetical protein NOM71_03990 [Archaeoglobi archaeon]|nr:hypothetical protein [Archaeoglobi archaeon]